MSLVKPQECMKPSYPVIEVLVCTISVLMVYPDGTHAHIHGQMKKPAGALKEKTTILNIFP